MLEFLFQHTMIYWRKPLTKRFASQNYLLSIPSIKLLGVFISGLIFSFLFTVKESMLIPEQ